MLYYYCPKNETEKIKLLQGDLKKGDMVMVYLRLLERIAFKKLTIAEISGKIGIDERSLRKKFIGLLPLYLDEARLISNVLDINSSDEMLYFFSPSVPKMG